MEKQWSLKARTDVQYRRYLSGYLGLNLPSIERAPGDKRTEEELHEDMECDHDCEICIDRKLADGYIND